jgi:hypothetical protein
MPCFYFDVRDGVNFTLDEVGREFDSLEAAERAAAKAAAEVGGDQLPNGDGRKVTVTLEVQRVEPPPAPHTRELGLSPQSP